MRIAIILLLLVGAAQAQLVRQVYGFPMSGMISGSSTFALNTANSRLAFSFVTTSSGTTATYWVVTQSVTGSPIAADIVCELFADSAGPTGSALATAGGNVTPASAGQWLSFTWSYAATAGTMYWGVCKNINGSPASNYATLRYTSQAGNPFVTWGSTVKTSTDGGSTYTSGGANSFGFFKLDWTTGSSTGFPYTSANVYSTTDSNTRVYDTRQAGFVFTLPAGAALKVVGCGFLAAKGTGSVTGNLSCVIYSDNGTTATSLGESLAVLPANVEVTAHRWVGLWLTTTLTLTGGNTYRVAMKDSAADTSANYYASASVTPETNSHSLMPIQGMRGTYCAATCTTSSNWSLSTSTPIAALILDAAGEFSPVSASGSFVFVR